MGKLNKINIMPKHLAELIAAGEVVERPASVVKELLENAIDAGASSITLEIKNGGISYIRITDNGCGISHEDIRNAFVSHATSKITTSDDLDRILTLGFRGEALPSIAAVAKVEVLTRTKEDETGSRYCIEFGEETLLDDAGCPLGTTITVRDLFLKTPARMKFLKKDVTEANAVAGVVDRIALSHPEVSIRFIREGKQTLITSGKGDEETCMREVLGKEFAQEMIPCINESGGVKVSGFISKPAYSRPNRNMQFFFLNHRFVKTGTGAAAVAEGYKGSIMVGKFPCCVINIEINPSMVDVNVHPAKTEIRFSDEKPVFNAVYGAVRNALSQGDTPKQVQLSHEENYKKYTEKPPETSEQIKFTGQADFWQHQSASDFREQISEAADDPKTIKNPVPFTPAKVNLDIVVEDDEPLTIPKVTTTVTAASPSDEPEGKIDSVDDILLNSPAKSSGLNDNFAARSVALDKDKNCEESPAPLPVDNTAFDEERFRLVGEAFMTYIICEYDKKLIIIDKHAAHERMIYERLKKENGERTPQILLMPVTVNLSKEEYAAILENTELLGTSGFNVEDFGSGSVIVTECPMELSMGDIPDVIREIAGRFVEKRQDVMFEKLDWIFHSVACRSAIKAGNITSKYEMEIFAKQLLSMPDIRYCPHGRPVLIEMTQRELEKNFGRI